MRAIPQCIRKEEIPISDGPPDFANVSILAPTGLQSDALSSAVFVLGCKRGVDLIRATSDVDAFFVHKDGRTRVTPGWPA